MKISKVTPLVMGAPRRNITFLRVDTDKGYSKARAINRNRFSQRVSERSYAALRARARPVYHQTHHQNIPFSLFEEGWRKRKVSAPR